jgi:hypothetical protein
LRLVERAALLVGVHRCARDRDDRADVEGKELLGVSGLEGNDVDEQVEAVGDGERFIVVAVERDVIEWVGRRPLVASRNGDLPVVSQRPSDRSADVARPTDDERALRDRYLGERDGVADADLAVTQNVCVKPATMDEALDHPRLGHRLEVGARFTQLDAFAFDVADLEPLADE